MEQGEKEDMVRSMEQGEKEYGSLEQGEKEDMVV